MFVSVVMHTMEWDCFPFLVDSVSGPISTMHSERADFVCWLHFKTNVLCICCEFCCVSFASSCSIRLIFRFFIRSDSIVLTSMSNSARLIAEHRCSYLTIAKINQNPIERQIYVNHYILPPREREHAMECDENILQLASSENVQKERLNIAFCLESWNLTSLFFSTASSYFHRSRRNCDSFKSARSCSFSTFSVHFRQNENGILTLFSSRFRQWIFFPLVLYLSRICFGYLPMIQMSILWRKHNYEREKTYTLTTIIIPSNARRRRENKHGEQSNGFGWEKKRENVSDATHDDMGKWKIIVYSDIVHRKWVREIWSARQSNCIGPSIASRYRSLISLPSRKRWRRPSFTFNSISSIEMCTMHSGSLIPSQSSGIRWCRLEQCLCSTNAVVSANHLHCTHPFSKRIDSLATMEHSYQLSLSRVHRYPFGIIEVKYIYRMMKLEYIWLASQEFDLKWQTFSVLGKWWNFPLHSLHFSKCFYVLMSAFHPNDACFTLIALSRFFTTISSQA